MVERQLPKLDTGVRFPSPAHSDAERIALFVRSKAAFTLVEMLVVISIIAVLAALIFPALSGMKGRANSVTCSNHLRQIFLAFQAYATEHDGVLPQRLSDNDFGYDEALLRYTGGNTKIFLCPSQKKTDYPHEPGYGMNWYYDNQPLSRVDLPALTIFVAETLGSSGDGSHRADRDGIDPGQLDPERHQRKANYLFFDGHAATLAYAETRREVTKEAVTNNPVDMWGKDWGDHDEKSVR